MPTLTLRSCTRWFHCSATVVPKYHVGDTLFRCDLATQGVIEKVTIKQILINPSGWPRVAIYKDMLNSLHNERDLCSGDEAAAAYYAWVEREKLRNQKRLCEFKNYRFPTDRVLPAERWPRPRR